MNFREKSELQLLRVSRGAHELTKMIDSWSKAPNVDGQSKHIANDLRRSAQELQESLLMLSRLQEASRKMSKMKMQQRGEEDDAEDDWFDVTRSNKNFERNYHSNGLQEPRLSVDGYSTNCMEDMRQVIRDRLHRNNLSSTHEKVSSTKPLMFSGSRDNFSAQAKKVMAPNLVAKLMGLEELLDSDQLKLEQAEEEEKVQKARNMRKGKEKINHEVKHKKIEEIIDTMRSIGVLKSEESVSLRPNSDVTKHGINFSKNCAAPPIVIMKSQYFPNSEREEINPTSKWMTEEKVKPEEMEQSAVRSMEMQKIEPPQKLKSASAASQKQLKRAVGFKASTSAEDPMKPEIQGKMHVERKGVKVIGSPKNMKFTAPIRPEINQATASTSQKNKNNITNSKKNLSLKSVSFNSTSSVKKAKISVENPVRKSTKPDNQKSREEKLNRPLTESHAVSRGNNISATDDLPKQAHKEPTKSCKREGIKKYYKVICEKMPRSYQFRKRLGEIEKYIKKSHYKSSPKIVPQVIYHFKHLLLNSPSFCNQVQELFDTNALQPAFYQQRYSGEHEIGTDQLLLDCAKELMIRKIQKGKLFINQMLRKQDAHQSAYTSFNHLLEEFSNGIKKLASYSEVGWDVASEDSLDNILEMDLHCHETMLNAAWDNGWDHWICAEEADQAVIEVADHIISGLTLEVVMDLRAYDHS